MLYQTKKQEKNNNIVKKRSQFIHKKTFNHFGALHSKTANINEYSFTIPIIKVFDKNSNNNKC